MEWSAHMARPMREPPPTSPGSFPATARWRNEGSTPQSVSVTMRPMAKRYWHRVCARAYTETRLVFGFETRGRTIIIVLLSITTILGLWAFGSPDSFRDRLVEISTIVGGILLVFPLAYVWNFIRSPAALDKETAESHAVEIERLTTEIESFRAKRNQSLLHELSDNLARFATSVRALPRGPSQHISLAAQEAYRRSEEIIEQLGVDLVSSDARDYLQCASIILDKKAHSEISLGDESELASIGSRLFAVLNSRNDLRA